MNATPNFVIEPLGDSALIVEFGNSADGNCRWRFAHAAAQFIDSRRLAGRVETVPAISSITIHYDPRIRDWSAMRDTIAACLTEVPPEREALARRMELPVCYAPEFGPDLARVAAHCGMSPAQVVDVHASGTYTVQMLGFAPGFAYFGGLSTELATPRLAVPRVHVPAGAVGIGDRWTGIYPIDIPGGWNLIGRTPWKLFRPETHPPTTLIPGDEVAIRRITLAEFSSWRDSR